jgi:hypothetical protein
VPPPSVQSKNWTTLTTSGSRRYSDPLRPSGITATWANEGGEKIPREDIRATTPATAIAPVTPAALTVSPVYTGDGTVRIFGARNETLGFCLQLESSAGATGLSVSVSTLTSGGNTITTTTRTNANYGNANSVCNYAGRNIEIFLLDYLPIETLSRLSYERYDERHVPHKLRAPSGSGPWASRPGAGKYFPEWCVPHEWRPTFSIAAGRSQGVWIDVYIPTGTPVGTYTGTVDVKKDGVTVRSIPLQVKVRNFTLPATPTARSIAYLNTGMTDRTYGASNSVNMLKAQKQMLHRHCVTPVTNEHQDDSVSPPKAGEQAQLLGTLYGSGEGYDGYGKDTGDRYYWIGIYGSAAWRDSPQATYATRLGEWANWFSANAPSCEYSVYLTDEPTARKVESIVKGATTKLVMSGTGLGNIGKTVTITGANNANGVTFTASGGHGWGTYSRHYVELSGFTGSWASLNGQTVYAYVGVSPNDFVVAEIDSTSLGALSGSPVGKEKIRVGGATGVTSINGTWTIVSKAEAGGNTEVEIAVDTSAAGTYNVGSAEASTDWAMIAIRQDKVVGAGSPGNTVKTFVTANMLEVAKLDPRIDIVAAWYAQERNPQYGDAVTAHKATSGHQYWQYNGKRIASGSWAVEDDGVALRAVTWAQWKKGIGAWYYWSANYYYDTQTSRETEGEKETNVWTNAITFGNASESGGDTNYGPRYGFNTTNGDGVLLAPGVDIRYPASAPGVLAPVASLRLKLWRRAIQDVEYIAQANAINAGSVTTIVNTRVPAVLWEVDVDSDSDPTYRNAPISWSIDPSDWETSRKALADIIDPAGA